MQVVILPMIGTQQPRRLPYQCEGCTRKTHSDKDGYFQSQENKRIYAEMKAIQDAVNDKKIDPKTDREIIAEVLQSNNRGHIAVLAGWYRARARVLGAHKRTQIPDLYTPRVFPGSTYDDGGPSSTPSAPSSSLGPDNCYYL
ncbi:hypothetical protein CTI12_AA384450 [Artemisia annua]|uniref:Uncharacterized protein n=1 Tax=Artemisia annua TaxID=35608 RepID=A0A2U1MAX1_ARTAN|nr:hypothetical protein CTI12_AA384450 [Artemisia annua]